MAVNILLLVSLLQARSPCGANVEGKVSDGRSEGWQRSSLEETPSGLSRRGANPCKGADLDLQDTGLDLSAVLIRGACDTLRFGAEKAEGMCVPVMHILEHCAVQLCHLPPANHHTSPRRGSPLRNSLLHTWGLSALWPQPGPSEKGEVG